MSWAGTKEQLLARNFSRLEDVIRANRGGIEKGDDTATRNAVKALSEQNRMLGVSNGAVNNFTVNTGQQGGGGINWKFERIIKFMPGLKEPAEDQIPEPPPQYSFPRLLEYKPSDLAPFPPDDAPSNPPPEPPPNPTQSGAKTEFELPEHQRFGFGVADQRSKKKGPGGWME